MDVILIRHATAVDETLELRDSMRMLSPPGRAQATQLGVGLHARGVVPTHVWTSPLVRAVQTAELVLAALGVTIGTEVAPALAPEATPRPLLAALRALPATAVVLVVGHEPGLSALGALLTGAADYPTIAKAEAACIRAGAPAWRLS